MKVGAKRRDRELLRGSFSSQKPANQNAAATATSLNTTTSSKTQRMLSISALFSFEMDRAWKSNHHRITDFGTKVLAWQTGGLLDGGVQ
jgi:hypothetical protein